MNASRWVSSALTVAEMEARRVRHDPTELLTRLIQPALWLIVFGEVFTTLRLIPTGSYTYLQFITPGILAQSVLFIAIFYGITVVWERDSGILTKLLSTPSPRSSIIVGKALAAGVRGGLQALMIFVLALLIGVNLRLDVFTVLGAFVFVVINAVCFSSLSMLLAALLKTRDRMMGIGQAITMPLFFASNAIYPTSLMPGWPREVVAINPLSYVVDALRSLLLTGDYGQLPVDLAFSLFACIVFAAAVSLAIKRLIE